LIKIIQPDGDTDSNWDKKKQNQQRQAKKIENLDLDARLNNSISNQFKNTEITDQNRPVKRNNVIVSSNTYAVKENIKEENQASDQTQQQQNKKRLKYELPKSATVNTKNNLTAHLLTILANYNIRTSDSLRNYDLSLRQNSRNLHNHDYVLMHVPVKLPMKYNNANHSPIDPLLAVFLSNYGHYIPSLYGFNGGYNNLYGYLASNNIHNNKPFGSYKIFSDTDSSH
ncbi:jg21884, partial [Pararge aegeria aegeria]